MIIGILCVPMFSILAPQVNSETASWTTKASLPQPQFGFGSAVANGRVYAIGGYQGESYFLNSNFEYNPLTDSWVTKSSMPTPRTELVVASVNDRIYAIGGSASTSGDALSVNEQYDPKLDLPQRLVAIRAKRDYLSHSVK